MDERPVTGSCEQCGRRYSLLIPVPGSGSTQLDRVAEVVGCCAECGRFVGRACCLAKGTICAGCVAERGDRFGPGTTPSRFAALAAARAAVREVDGAAAGFSAVREALAATRAVDGDATRSAWEDAWLAAGALRVRIDSARDAATSRLRALPGTEAERILDLEDDLAAAMASHDARWQSVVEGLVEAGRRAAEAVPDEPRQRSAPVLVPATSPPDAAADADAAVAADASGEITTPAPVTAPATRRPERRVPAQAATRAGEAGDAAFASSEPVARARPEPSSEPSNVRRTRRGVVPVMLIGTLVIGGALLARVIVQPGADLAATNGDTDLPPVGGVTSPLASSTGQAPSPSLVLPTERGISLALLVNFDLHPVGPVDVDELPVADVVGVAEVTPFPTPFDRSLRLAGPAAGVCMQLPAQALGPVASMAFDLHLGEAGSFGSLAFGLSSSTSAPGGDLSLDLAALAELDRDAWYRLVVTSTGESGVVTVSALDDDRSALEVELATAEMIMPASRDAACIFASELSADASLLVDNLRIDR